MVVIESSQMVPVPVVATPALTYQMSKVWPGWNSSAPMSTVAVPFSSPSRPEVPHPPIERRLEVR